MISLESILSAAIQDRRTLSTLRNAVTEDLCVANVHYRNIMNWVVEFSDQYDCLPTDEDAHVWMLSLHESKQSPTRSAWKELKRQDVSGYTLEFLADTGLKELRKIAARNASRLMSAMPDDVDPEMLDNFSQRVKNIRPVELTGLIDLAEVNKYARPRSADDDVWWPSGIDKLDRYIRGFGRELIFVMAESGLGKSTFLLNIGQAAALQGANVFHLSFELDLHAASQRYYRRIAEADKGEFNGEIEHVRSRLGKWFQLARGHIHLMYEQPYSITTDDLKALVDLFEERHGKMDMLLLDYIDLIKRTREQASLPRDEQERRISHETRAISIEHNATVISAAQANLQGYDSKTLRLKNMGGGAAKVQAGDIVLGLSQTDDEFAINQARISILKMREGAGKRAEIPLHVDLDKMIMMDLDSPDARRLRMNGRKRKAYA